MTMCRASRVDKADGSDSGRVMAALSDAAVIDVTAADQSRVKVGCRTGGNHVKMPWQRAACSGLKCAIPLWMACSRNPPAGQVRDCVLEPAHAAGPQVPGTRSGGWLARRAAGAGRGDRSTREGRSEAGIGHRGVGWHRQGLRRGNACGRLSGCSERQRHYASRRDHSRAIGARRALHPVVHGWFVTFC